MAKKQANAVDAHVGGRVRTRRTVLGLSQERLGEMLGITFQQIQKYERGVNRISAGRLFEIARILGVNLPYFYEGLTQETSRRSHGFAEDAAPAPAPMDSTSAEAAQLVAAYSRIPDPKLRRQVLELVKSLSAGRKKRRG